MNAIIDTDNLDFYPRLKGRLCDGVAAGLKKIMEVENLQTDSELANILGISAAELATIRKNGSCCRVLDLYSKIQESGQEKRA